MIREKDFQALIKVFHGAIKEMAEKDSFMERRSVIIEWEDLMNKVNVCAAQILNEDSRKVRLDCLAEFEERLKEFGYDKKLQK